jgi:hypothetical protein
MYKVVMGRHVDTRNEDTISPTARLEASLGVQSMGLLHPHLVHYVQTLFRQKLAHLQMLKAKQKRKDITKKGEGENSAGREGYEGYDEGTGG